MLRRLGNYIRQQHLALFAVFIALGGSAYAAATIDSAKVVNNSLTGADIKGQKAKGRTRFSEGTLTGDDVRGSSAVRGRKAVDGSLRGEDVADNSLAGADINEASLGLVPGADTLDGKDSSAFIPISAMADFVKRGETVPNAANAANASQLGGAAPGAFGTGVLSETETIASCGSAVNTNNHCAQITVRIPPGKQYRAVVWSSFSATSGPSPPTAMSFYYCPEIAIQGATPGCINGPDGNAAGTTVLKGQFLASGAATATVTLSPGIKTFSTRINPNSSVDTSNANSYTTTTVMLFDSAAPALDYDDCRVSGCGGGSSGTSSGGSSGTSSGTTSSSGTSSGGSSGTSSGGGSSGTTSSSGTSGF